MGSEDGSCEGNTRPSSLKRYGFPDDSRRRVRASSENIEDAASRLMAWALMSAKVCLETIADRLQVGAEELDERAVELLVKLRPV